MKRIWIVLLLTSCLTVLGGCQKGELRENDVNDESEAAIELSAGSPFSVVAKAAVDKWKDSEVNVFGLKRKRDAVVGSGVYDFSDPGNIVDYPAVAASGTSASLEVYADKDAEVPYYYAEGYVYDFYGYHLGGATVTDTKSSGDTYSCDVTFYGNNDLMYADTDRAKDIAASGDPSVTETAVYSAWSARRDVHPSLVFHHALARLNFIVKGKGDSWQDVSITGIDVKSVNTGTLTVTGTDIGFTPSETAPAVLSLKTAADEDFVSEDVSVNPDNMPAGGEGACLMVAPGMKEIEVTVHMKNKLHAGQDLSDYSFKVKASDVLNKDEDGNVVPVTSFESGRSYDFYISVYGPEEIVITAQITDWEKGGDYVFDPDDYTGDGNDQKPEPETLHKVTGVQVYDDGQYYGVIRFSYDEQERLVSTDAVWNDGGTLAPLSCVYEYTTEGMTVEYYGDDDAESWTVGFDELGRPLNGCDCDIEYHVSGEESEVHAYYDGSGQLDKKWVVQDGNIVHYYNYMAIPDEREYEYYEYGNDYSIDMNSIMSVFGYGEAFGTSFYTEPLRMLSFTCKNLLKSDGEYSYSYEFDEDGKVSSIEMVSANATYTLTPHYDSFDEIFDAFPELPSEDEPETVHEVAGLRYYEDGECIGVVRFEYDENGRQTRYEAKVQETHGGFTPISVLYEYRSDYMLMYPRYSEDETMCLQPIKISFDSDGRVYSIVREYDNMDMCYEYSDGLVKLSGNTLFGNQEVIQFVQKDGNILGIQNDTYNEYYSYPNNYSVDLCNVLFWIRSDSYYLCFPFAMYRAPGLTSANLLKSGTGGTYEACSYEFDEQDRVSLMSIQSVDVDAGVQNYEVEVYYDGFDEVYVSFGSVVVSSEEKIVKNVHVVTSSGMEEQPGVTIDYDFSYDKDGHVRYINTYGVSGDDEGYMWLNISGFDRLSGSYDAEEWLSGKYQWTMSYDFDENGLPVSCQRSVEYDSDELLDLFSSTFLSGDTETISYDTDGHVTEIAESYASGSDSHDRSVRLSWNDGNIVSESYLLPGDSEYTTVNYEYSSIEDKTNIDLTRLTYYTGIYYRGGHYMSDKSVFKGLSSRLLPSRTEDVDEGVYDWSYVFDDQGYVTEITVKADNYSEKMYIEYY